jgi:ribosomal protein S18 acetylase RimI-like enzyme
MMMNIKTLPPNITVRPTRLEDLPDIYEHVVQNEIASDGRPSITMDRLESFYQRPEMNLEADTLSVLDGEKVIASIGIQPWHHSKVDIFMDIMPSYAGQGIGEYLMEWAEQRAIQEIALAEPDVRVYLSSGTSAKNTTQVQLYQKYGYQYVRSFWRMKRELNEQPEPAEWSEGITVRSASPDMLYAVYEADEEAFKDHWGYIAVSYEQWKRWMIDREDFNPDLWFLAMDGEQIAGFALCGTRHGDEGWINVLGVRRPWRKRGVGLALLRHSFAELYKRGLPAAYLGVDAQSLTGAVRLYERAGMHVFQKFSRFEKELRAGRELSTQTVEE